MTREEVMLLLDKLDLSSSMDYYDVRNKVKKLNYSLNVQVCSGETKICLVFEDTDFIVKWSQTYNDDKSESVKESRIYTHAVEAGLEMFFPKTEVLGKWGDVTVVIQDKIDYSVQNCNWRKEELYQNIGRTVTDKIFEKMKKGFRTGYCDRRLDSTWAKLVISLYGKKVTKKLCEFIQEYKINDLHNGNIGYKNNKPIILDFSGYHPYAE